MRVCDVYKKMQEFRLLLDTAAKCAETPCEKDLVASVEFRFEKYGELMRTSAKEIDYLERIAYSDS